MAPKHSLPTTGHQFLALTTARILATAFYALAFITLGRTTPVSYTGLIGVIVNTGQFVSAIADLGMSSFLAQNRAADRGPSVAAGLRLNAFTSVAFGCIGCAVLTLLPIFASTPWAIVLLAPSLAIDKNTETALSVPVADGKRLLPAVSILLRRGLLLALLAAGLIFGISPKDAFPMAYLIASIIGQLQLRRWLSQNTLASTRPSRYVAETVRRGIPFLISNLTAQARLLDTLMLAVFSFAAQVGLYASATRITSAALLIPTTLSTVILPRAVRASEKETGRMVRNMTLAFIFCIGPFAAIGLLSPELVDLLFGPRYIRSAPILALSLTAIPLVALSSPLGAILQGKGHQKYVAANGALFATLLIIAMAVGAGVANGTGVAAAIGIVYAAKCAALLFRIHQGTTKLER